MAQNKYGFGGWTKRWGLAPAWGRLPPPYRLPPISVWALPIPGVLPGVSQAIQKGWACFASPWESLESLGWCEEWIKKGTKELGSIGGSLGLAPSTRLPLSRDCIPGLPGLPSLGLEPSQLSSNRLLGTLLQPERRLLLDGATPPVRPIPTPNCATPGPTHVWDSAPGSGTYRSGCSKAGDHAGLGGPLDQGAHPWGPCLAQAPARSQAAAGRFCAERKPQAQTERGGWCERLGPVPARRGWNTMYRAGVRAGSENSLTQQLGKWVCSFTR